MDKINIDSLTEEDLEKLAEKIIAIRQLKRGGKLSLAGIAHKYENKLRKKFKSAWGVEQAIRIVACAMLGYSHSRELPEYEIGKACEVMEKLYKEILKEE